MHALTYAGMRVRVLTDQAERLGLAAAVEALDRKLAKLDSMKPVMHFIGWRYGRHAMAVGGHLYLLLCTVPVPVLIPCTCTCCW